MQTIPFIAIPCAAKTSATAVVAELGLSSFVMVSRSFTRPWVAATALFTPLTLGAVFASETSPLK